MGLREFERKVVRMDQAMFDTILGNVEDLTEKGAKPIIDRINDMVYQPLDPEKIRLIDFAGFKEMLPNLQKTFERHIRMLRNQYQECGKATSEVGKSEWFTTIRVDGNGKVRVIDEPIGLRAALLLRVFLPLLDGISMDRIRDCEECGRVFIVLRGYRKRFCSHRCAVASTNRKVRGSLKRI